MDLIGTLLLTVGISAGTTGLIIVLLRAGGPVIERLFGGVLRARAQLDQDRDRITLNLRSENADIRRRLDDAEARAAAAEAEVTRLNAFIDMLLDRMGTTRAAIENGAPLPPLRRRR